MRWLSINDIRFGIKRKFYELEHNASGKTLIYDSSSKQYVGYIDTATNYFQQDNNYLPSADYKFPDWDMQDTSHNNDFFDLF
jgi:hypothetical protein